MGATGVHVKNLTSNGGSEAKSAQYDIGQCLYFPLTTLPYPTLFIFS